MATRRRSIKLLPHERALLVEAYLRRRTPIDQYEVRHDELEEFVQEWNGLTGRTDSAADLLHYMRSQRKRSLWVRFEEGYQPPPAVPEMSPEETEALVEIYRENVAELAHGSDVLGYDPEIAGILAKEFAAETGRIIPAHELIAKLTALRKRGLLPKAADVPPPDADDDIGFSDIDLVG